MKRCITIWQILVTALLFTGTLCAGTQGANAASKKLLIGSFDDVVIDGDMQVNIITGKSPSGIATGDRRVLDLLRIDRETGAVRIRVQRPVNDDIAIRITQPLVINLTNQTVRHITMRGNAKLKINAVKQNDASRIFMTGGGKITIDQFNSDTLKASLFGTGKLVIGGGKVRSTRLEIEGASTYDGAQLKTQSLELIQRGNATTAAQVENDARLSNEGSGTIAITGKAECFITKAGFAIITCPRDKKAVGVKKR
jgi:hypothetical protein